MRINATDHVSKGPKEGYYKFNPRFVETCVFQAETLSELNRWRQCLFSCKLIGMYTAGELKGVGYGNISVRTPGGFMITATRTGGLEKLAAEHYAEISRVDLEHNAVDFRAATSATMPSSECMTHAMFYQAYPTIGAVIHVHSLDFWRRLLNQVPTTASDVEYGTPSMAFDILRLFRETDLAACKLVAMAGHEEGVISFGRNLDEAGTIMLEAWRGVSWSAEAGKAVRRGGPREA
ncbi:MAG: class II aldolase/adducin family protein [bacterium]